MDMAATGRVERGKDIIGEDSYGLDEDRCFAYLRTLEALMEKGRIVGHQALTHRRELLLIRAYIQRTCTERFHSCFEDRGWLAVETPEMLADWAIEPKLGPCDTPMERLAHKIVKEYKDVYYAHWWVEADRAAEKMVAKQSLVAERQSLAEERAAREALAAELAS